MNLNLISRAISKLVPNQIEVVVHDLKEGRIVHLEGTFSNRSIGDESLITEKELALISSNGNITEPYTKTDANKGLTTSISVLIEDTHNGDFMMCINMSIQPLLAAMTELTSFIDTIKTPEQEHSFTKNDWRESINNIIYKKLNEIGISLTSAKKEHRITLISELSHSAFLQNKGAPEYVIKTLGISKATLDRSHK